MTEPTDDEIMELAKPFITRVGSHWENDNAIPDNGRIEEFARAVLAKWGTPPAVAGEPDVFLLACEVLRIYGGGPHTVSADLSLSKPETLAGLKFLESALLYAWRLGAKATHLPTQAQTGAVPQYRLLQPGVDRIEDDDEFLSDDTTTWAIDPNGIFSGNIYGGHVLRPARRRIKGGQHGPS